MNMFDPVKKALEIEKTVVSGEKRKYYRFRPARFYGGIATADCVGCCLKCVFCWSWREVAAPAKHGKFHSPGEVAEKLTGIAARKGYRQVRISGNEPTLGREHLIEVVEKIPKNLLFILETNGILIGHDKTCAQALSRFENIHVRVSLKGCCGSEFSELTGAVPEGFHLQLKALEHLVSAGVSAHPAVMTSFSSPARFQDLKKTLKSIHRSFVNVEKEDVVMYRDVEKRIKRLKSLAQRLPEGVRS